MQKDLKLKTPTQFIMQLDEKKRKKNNKNCIDREMHMKMPTLVLKKNHAHASSCYAHTCTFS
jgi:predicted nucleic acid-binding protein